ncbi:MAG: hypothetical protein M3177_02535 [Pseudomonadota bacterium]|nr:hypothetical protein [Pseudomonadota bacterium]
MSGERKPSEQDTTSDRGAIALPADSETGAKEDPLGFLDPAAKRAFSESEVSQAITIRFLVERLKEHKRDIDYLRPFQERSYQLERDLQIERGKVKLTKTQEIASLALTGIGSAGMALAFRFWDHDPKLAVAGFILFAGIAATGIYLKVSSK